MRTRTRGPAISILVAEAQRLAAEALVTSLAGCADLRPLTEITLTGEDTAEAARRLHPDVVLLDFWIPGDLDALGTTRAIRALEPAPKVLLVSALVGGPQADAALASGASAFLPRSLSLQQVADAARRASSGESPVFAEELHRAVQEVEIRESQKEQSERRLMALSPREREILRALAKGHSLDRVAGELYLSLGTVRNHIQTILKKTGARNQREAVNIARRIRMLPQAYAKEMGEHPGATPGLDDG